MFELTTSFQADPFPQKVSLGAGAYKDDEGKPWILPSVKLATERLMSDPLMNHEYQGIAGHPSFVEAAAKLVLGPEVAASGRVASVQTIRCVACALEANRPDLRANLQPSLRSGTGACHLGALFLSRFYNFPAGKKVYIPSAPWSTLLLFPRRPLTLFPLSIVRPDVDEPQRRPRARRHRAGRLRLLRQREQVVRLCRIRRRSRDGA